ncbi:outer membrane protein [Ralstonia soli]|uniref:Outer membrane beta-barrel protein n=1 Tax=Ralstonia soli TaxID=2953896 RepID=A0ABT1AGS3_9RALS|nr:outer membrane beta-barrel protein [Ralstonia soli]MCO5397566.1 outer membrane beta-barrel protein [Ralstonia soli]
MIKTVALPGALALLFSGAAFAQTAADASKEEGYYGAARIVGAKHKANNMDATARPGIGSFVQMDDSANLVTGSFALGYDFGNGWRTEGEYTLPRNDTFTSGSSAFPSYNQNNIRSQRVMANVYRDFAVAKNVSVYAMGGLGLASLKSGGSQNNPNTGVNNPFNSSSQTNLAWSLGAGVSYSPMKKVNLDLGYRYVDMGKAESGWNAFRNARGLQDEMMRANLVSHEIYLGARYKF